MTTMALRIPAAAGADGILRHRYVYAALIALGVHAAALTPLLMRSPPPMPMMTQAIMVGVTVDAPMPSAAPPPAPAPKPMLPRQVTMPATVAPPTPHSIEANDAQPMQPTPAPPQKVVETPAPATAAATRSTPPTEEANATEPPSYKQAYLDNPRPQYPPVSRKLREEGVALLRVLVDANGRAEAVKLQTSSGYARLDQAALAAVRNWRFVPARRLGMNVAGWIEVPIQFRLEN